MRSIIIISILLSLGACSAPKDEAPKPASNPVIQHIDLSLAPNDGEDNWTIDLKASKLEFEAFEKRIPFQGELERFNIAVSLDPNNPETGEITAAIDIASVQTGNADRDDTLATSEWFYTEKYPIVEFQSERITQTGENSYAATGILSVKDIANEIVLPFTLVQNGKEALAKAEFEFNRLDYRIGIGSFSDEKYVGYPVKIFITVVASQ